MERLPQVKSKSRQPIAVCAEAPDAFALDAQVRQYAGAIHQQFLALARVVRQIERAATYIKFQDPATKTPYPGVEEYLERRHGLSYRTIRRWLQVLEGLERLPARAQPEAEIALTALGAHKAAVLEAVLGTDGQDWRAWVKQATDCTEEALRERVNTALGRKSQPLPPDSFLRYVLSRVPEDAREEVREVFTWGHRLWQRDGMGTLLAMVAEVKVEWGRKVARTGKE